MERLLRALHEGADCSSGGEAALDLIAAYFQAERAVLTTPGGLAQDPGGSPDPTPDVREEILVGGEAGVGTVALYGSERTRSWTEHDARRLRVAAQTVCESLRRLEAESSLDEQGIWLKMAMDSARVGVWDWDVPGDRVRYVSPLVNPTEGLRIRETWGSAWFEMTNPEDARVSRPEVDRAIAGETDEFSMVVRQRVFSGKHAEWFHIYSRGRVVERDGTGRARRIMGTFEDVTEARLKAEAEARREDAMARAARMASLGVIASSLAHDLNQPLTALTSFLEGSVRLVAKGKASDADLVGALKRSVAFAYRASDIVRGFRRLLQREAPLSAPVDLGSVLLTVRDRLHREAVAAGVEIRVQRGLEPVVAPGDALQIEQLVVNLGRNAIEALQEIELSPRIVTLEARAGDGHAELRVADTGPGIPVAVVDRLFEPLSTSKEAGRGLGLAICRSIAEIHGGRLTVERTGPDGTTFLLELPVDIGGSP